MVQWNIKDNCYTRQGNNLEAGTYKVHAEFISNEEDYGQSESTPLTITVKKIGTFIELIGIDSRDGFDLGTLSGDNDSIDINITPIVKDQFGEDITGTMPFKLYCNDELIYPTQDSPVDTRTVRYFIDTDGDYTFYGEVEENYKYTASKSSSQTIHINDSRLVSTNLETTITSEKGTPLYATDLITIDSKVYNSTDNSVLSDSELDKVTTLVTGADDYVGTHTLTQLFDSGEYTVKVKYPTTSSYASSHKELSFTVLKSTSTFKDFTASKTLADSGETITVSAKLIDIHDNPIINKPCTLTVTCNGVTVDYDVQSDMEGICTTDVTIFEAGTALFNWKYDGNSVYESTESNGNGAWKVTFNDVSTNLTLLTEGELHRGWYYATQLKTGKGEPLRNQVVTYEITGNDGKKVKYQLKTDDEGVSKLQINLIYGKYPIKVSYAGNNGLNNSSSFSKTLTVREPLEQIREPKRLMQHVSAQHERWNSIDASQLKDSFIRCEVWQRMTGKQFTPAPLDGFNYGFTLPKDCTITEIYSLAKLKTTATNNTLPLFKSVTIKSVISPSGYSSTRDTSTTVNAPIPDSWKDYRNRMPVNKYKPETINSPNFGARLEIAPNSDTAHGGKVDLDQLSIRIKYIPKQVIEVS